MVFNLLVCTCFVIEAATQVTRAGLKQSFCFCSATVKLCQWDAIIVQCLHSVVPYM